MKRGLDRATQSSVVGNGKERDGAFLSTEIMPLSYYHNDISDRNKSSSQDCNGGGGCCLGGWLSSLLSGGGGERQGPPTKAVATTTSPNDDPAALVAEELNKLSLKEREVVYEDLHGVSLVEDESNQELVNKRLNEMRLEIDKIPTSKKIAYLIAIEEFGDIGKEFVHDTSLQLMFLRADRWNSKKAALRFVGWLDFKLELFGRDVLCHRHITIDKLDKDTVKTMKAGSFQILPQRDTSGRTVIFDNIGQLSKCLHSVKSMLQQFWYMMMATVEDDIHAQRMGVVAILYSIGGSLSFTGDSRTKYLYEASRMAPFLPIRLNSLHCCFNDPNLGPIISMMQKGVGSHIRARFRIHEGKHTEVQYSLMSYGMPADVLPVMTDGTIQKINHLKWYKRRKARDSTLTNLVGGSRHGDDIYGIDLPGRFDILLGKGHSIQQHMGNRRLKELIYMHFQEYDNALHGDKKSIAEKVIRLLSGDKFLSSNAAAAAPLPVIVEQEGSPVQDNTTAAVHAAEGVVGAPPRFLKRRNDGWWEQVTHNEAIEKVCHSFRAYRSSNAARKPTSTVVVDNSGTGETTNPSLVGSLSSSTSIARGTTKRVKVETQTSNIVKQPDMMPLLEELSSELPLSLFDGDDDEEQEQELAIPIPFIVNSTTTTEDEEVLDLDDFDWDM